MNKKNVSIVKVLLQENMVFKEENNVISVLHVTGVLLMLNILIQKNFG